MQAQDIEYRGQRKTDRKWVYGFYYKTQGRHIILGDTLSDSGAQHEIEVIPQTVSLYTGIRDNTRWVELSDDEKREWLQAGKEQQGWRGKRIYGGDIVRDIFNPETAKIGIVHWGVWELGQRGYGFHCWIAGDNAIGCHQDEKIAHDLQVIGNIHNNPKLVKKIRKFQERLNNLRKE